MEKVLLMSPQECGGPGCRCRSWKVQHQECSFKVAMIAQNEGGIEIELKFFL